jgi:hypothetical protein
MHRGLDGTRPLVLQALRDLSLVRPEPSGEVKVPGGLWQAHLLGLDTFYAAALSCGVGGTQARAHLFALAALADATGGRLRRTDKEGHPASFVAHYFTGSDATHTALQRLQQAQSQHNGSVVQTYALCMASGLRLHGSRAQDAALVQRLVATLESSLAQPSSQLQAVVPGRPVAPRTPRAHLHLMLPLCAVLGATTIYLVGCAVMRGQVQAFVAETSGE